MPAMWLTASAMCRSSSEQMWDVARIEKQWSLYGIDRRWLPDQCRS
jgi:hypothetical protein